MDYEFSSLEELYKRVSPALHAKEVEMHRLGYFYIKDIDIWNYLTRKKWKNGKDLMLSDIVSDIMHADCREIDAHLKGKDSRKRRLQDFDDGSKNIEVR